MCCQVKTLVHLGRWEMTMEKWWNGDQQGKTEGNLKDPAPVTLRPLRPSHAVTRGSRWEASFSPSELWYGLGARMSSRSAWTIARRIRRAQTYQLANISPSVTFNFSRSKNVFVERNRKFSMKNSGADSRIFSSNSAPPPVTKIIPDYYENNDKHTDTVTCRPVAGQGPRDKQIYKSRYWVTPSQSNMFSRKRLNYNNEERWFLCHPCQDVISESVEAMSQSVGYSPAV
jgi:hypothetical protein